MSCGSPCASSNAVCLNKPPPWSKKNQFVPSCVPFDGVSTYRQAFTGCLAPRTKSLKPATFFDPSCAPFDGISTYRSAFPPVPVCPYSKPPWANKAQFDPSCAPFDGISTYRGDYRGCVAPRAQSLKPNTTFDPSCAPMDDKTTHRAAFVPYCLRESMYAKQKSAKPENEGGISCAPFDGMTTYRCDFFPRCTTRIRSMKPDPRPRFSDSPFADCTTYRKDFPPFHFVNCDGDTAQSCAQGSAKPRFCHDPCPPPDMSMDGPPCGGCGGGESM